jgi:hypothetical protein
VPRSGRKYLQPSDTKPTRRQLAEIRQRAVGVWAEQVKAAGEAVNVAVTSECICPEPDGWATACPIHGIQASLSVSAESPEESLEEAADEEEEEGEE